MDIAELPPLQQTQAIVNWMHEQPGQIEIRTDHHFFGGIYEREIFVPAGTLLAGKIHLTEHLAKLSKGTMTIYQNGESQTVTGPVTFKSQPGIRRLGYAHDDCVFSNFHLVPDGVDTPEAAEKLLVVDSEQAYIEATRQLEGCSDGIC